MRLRNAVTGVTVSVDDDHPIVADAQWEPVDEEKPTRGRVKASKDDES